MYRIGVDIGGTKINIGLFKDDDRKLIAHKKVYVTDISDLSNDIKAGVGELCTANGIKYGDIVSCGVGIPGTVSADGKEIIKVPNIGILAKDTAIKLEKTLKVPVKLVQDSRAAAWGEYLCGGATGTNTSVCVTLGTGIGTGIVMNGEIYNGALGCAGELGHLVAVENGRECGCGKKGCLEKYCAGGGLDITAKELLGAGKTASDLFSESKKGNEKAQEVINNAVKMLGRGLIAIVNLMSPECILFSGGLSDQEELYLNPLIDYIKEHCYSAGELPVIKKAELGEFSPLYGAAFVPNKEIIELD